MAAVDRFLASFARHLAAATAVSALAAVWAIAAMSLLAAPLAIAFVGIAFWWSITRVEPVDPFAVPDDGRCGGCAAGCVECRERIDVT